MKKIFLSLILVFALLYVSAVNADCNLTVSSPVGNFSEMNASYNGTGVFNVTVFFEARSTVTQNSSFSSISNITNSSRPRVSNLTLPNSVILQDADNYEFRATCYWNGSSAQAANAVQVSSTVSNVLLDRTKPSAATAITYTNPVQDADTITATIDRANANRCYIKFGGNSLTPMTLSGSTCTYTAQRGVQTPPDSDYKFLIKADDRTNNTDTADTNYVTIDHDQSDGGGLFGGTIVTSEGNGQSSIGISNNNPFSSKKADNKVIAIILLVVVFLYFKNKK